MAADARTNIVQLPFLELVSEIRIGKERSPHSHHVDLPFCNFSVCKLGIIESAAADYRNIDPGLHFFYIFEITGLRHIDRRMRPVPCVVRSVVAVKHVVARFFEHLCDFLTFIVIASELLILFTRKSASIEVLCLGNNAVADRNREIFSAFLLDRPNNFTWKSQTIFQTSAVLVLSLIPRRDCKLVQQIAFVHCMNFYAVYAGIFCRLCPFRKPPDILMDLINGHFRIVLCRIPDIGHNAWSRIVRINRRSTGKRADHNEYFRSVLMNSVGKILHMFCIRIGIVYNTW